MFTVIAEKHHQKQLVSFGSSWGHSTPEAAVAHAEARSRFDGLRYIVLHDGKTIYSTI